MKKLREGQILGMLAAFQLKMFCLSICYKKNIKIRIYWTIILQIILCGDEIGSHLKRRVLVEGIWEQGNEEDIQHGMGEVIGVLWELHNELLCDLCSWLNIIWQAKLGRMRWAGHLACMREVKCIQGFYGEIWRKTTT